MTARVSPSMSDRSGTGPPPTGAELADEPIDEPQRVSMTPVIFTAELAVDLGILVEIDVFHVLRHVELFDASRLDGRHGSDCQPPLSFIHPRRRGRPSSSRETRGGRATSSS